MSEVDIDGNDTLSGDTSLCSAAAAGQKLSCDVLLRRGAKISATNLKENPALHLANRHGHWSVADLLLNRADVHHVYPRKHLKDLDHSSSSYNQIANFVMAQSEINIAIGDKAPEIYFAELRDQVNGEANGGSKRYGGINDAAELRANLVMNCLPTSLLDGEPLDYDAFLVERRRLMAEKIRQWVAVL